MKRYLFIFIGFIAFHSGLAQNSGFNYQAVVRDDKGKIVTQESIELRFTISASSVDQWQEVHSTTTSEYGMVNLVLGSGTKTGGTAVDFESIDWGADGLKVSVEVNLGDGFILVGNQDIQSVPVANYARNGLSPEQSDKLENLDITAEENVQADWGETDFTSDTFINNKPPIPSDINELTDADGLLIDQFDGSFNSLTDVPAGLDTNAADDFSGDYADLQNKPNIPADVNELSDINALFFSRNFNDLTNVPVSLDLDATDDFSGNFGDLTNVPSNLDTDVTDDFDGSFNSLTDVPAGLDINAADDFSGDYNDLSNKPAIPADVNELSDANALFFSRNFNDLTNVPANLDTDATDDFSGSFTDLTNVPATLDLNATDDFDGSFNSLTDVPAGLDTNAADDFSGDYNDLANKPNIPADVNELSDANALFFSRNFNDLTNVPTNLDLDATDDFDGSFNNLTDVPAGLDTNAADDFSGDYKDLANKPTIPADVNELSDATALFFSRNFNDLTNVPANLDTDATDDFSGSFTDLTNVPATLDLDATDDFDGSFSSLTDVPAGLDTNAADDFSGDYNDLANKPTIPADVNELSDATALFFSRNFNDLTNVPATLDLDATDDFDGSFKSLTDVPAGLDTNAADDFSGDYDDLANKPIIPADVNELSDVNALFFSRNFNDLTNVPATLDLDATDDFDGSFNSLTDVPANLDTDATDDFSGSFTDLTDVPVNLDTDATDDFSGSFGDLTNVPATLDLDATDDFDGSFNSLTDVPTNLDTDATDDFSGNFTDLTNSPWSYNLNDNITTTGSQVVIDGSQPNGLLRLSGADPSIYISDSDGTSNSGITGANGYLRMISSESAVLFLDANNDHTSDEFRIDANSDSFSGSNVNLLTVKESGNVGIGTNDPQFTLEVNGSLRTQSLGVADFAADNSISIGRGVETASISMGNGNGTEKWRFETETTGQFGYNGNFLFKSKFGAAFDSPVMEVARISHDGLWGIWNNNPQHELDISSQGGAASIRLRDGGTGAPAILESNGSENYLWMGNESSSLRRADGDFKLLGNDVDIALSTDNGTTSQVFLSTGGNVGINTDNPGAALDVNGTIKSPNIQLTDQAGSGRVLTSDANGNASWQDPNTLITETGWEAAGNVTTTTGDANITGALTTGGLILETASGLGRVLTSDANGNASWQDPNTLVTETGWEAAGNVTTTTGDANITGALTTGGLILETASGLGRVLTSDASGNASWQDPNTLINDSGWSPVNNGLSENVNNVSIDGSLSLARNQSDALLALGNGNGTAKWQIETEATGPYNYNGNLIFKSKMGEVWDAPMVEAMRLSRWGNMGLGTNNPLYKMTLEAAGAGEINILGIGNPNGQIGDEANILFYQNQQSQALAKMGAYITNNSPTSSDLRFSTVDQGNWNEDAMTLKANGRLGLGTTDPQGLLHLNGADPTINLTDSDGTSNSGITSANGYLRLNSNESAVIFLDANNDNTNDEFRIDANSGSFSGANVNLLTVKENGKVGIGTTSPSGALHVKASIDDTTPSGPSIASHVMVIENTSALNNNNVVPNPSSMDVNNFQIVNTNSNNGLAINLNVPQYHLDTKNHFISFYRDENNLAGRIEGEHTADFLQLRQLVEGTISSSGTLSSVLTSGLGSLMTLDLGITYNSNFIDWNEGEFPDLDGSWPTFSGGSLPNYGLSGGSWPSIQMGSWHINYGIGTANIPYPTSSSLTGGSWPSLTGGPGTLPTLSAFPTWEYGTLPSLSFSNPFTFSTPSLSFSNTAIDDIVNTFTNPTFLGQLSGIGATASDAFALTDPIELAVDQATILANTLSTGGVTYQSGSGDYAEWLEMEDTEEEFRPGDVVGVHAGKISKTTEGADHVMIISVDPIVLGNAPEAGREEDFRKVAFMGQVPVRTYGIVRKGDILVASGYNNGEAVGITPEDLKIEHLSRIVGVAWSDSYNDWGNSYVKASVGLRTQDMAIIFKKVMANMTELMVANDHLETKVETMDTRFDDLQAQLSALSKLIVPAENSMSQGGTKK